LKELELLLQWTLHIQRFLAEKLKLYEHYHSLVNCQGMYVHGYQMTMEPIPLVEQEHPDISKAAESRTPTV
jgi:hypothetical protein